MLHCTCNDVLNKFKREDLPTTISQYLLQIPELHLCTCMHVEILRLFWKHSTIVNGRNLINETLLYFFVCLFIIPKFAL